MQFLMNGSQYPQKQQQQKTTTTNTNKHTLSDIVHEWLTMSDVHNKEECYSR